MSRTLNLEARQHTEQAIKRRVVHAVWVKYQETFTERYPEAEEKKLNELIRIYRETQVDASNIPDGWELDENKVPRCYINPLNWLELANRQLQRQGGVRIFYRYSRSIAVIAASYLQARKARIMGSGKIGDVIAQIFCEMMDFAINVLGQLTPEQAIERLQLRLTYIDHIRKNTLLFKRGHFGRQHNKHDKLQLISREIRDCIAYAEQERVRKCARDELADLRANLQQIVLSALEYLFYARKTSVQLLPFCLRSFIFGPHARDIPTRDDELYKKIKSTVTGRMLQFIIGESSAIALAGPERLDDDISLVEISCKTGISSGCITRDLKPIPIILSTINRNDLDLPDWLNTVEAKSAFIESLQIISVIVARLSKLVRLVDCAYDLAGDEGNRWAYGDEDGRDSLQLLVRLIEEDCRQLIDAINQLDQNNEHNIALYNRRHNINYNEGSNPNFTLAHYQAQQMLTAIRAVIKDCDNINLNIRYYPDGRGQKVRAQKAEFLHELERVCRLYYKIEPTIRGAFSIPNTHDQPESKENDSQIYLQTDLSARQSRWQAEVNRNALIGIESLRNIFAEEKSFYYLSFSSEKLEKVFFNAAQRIEDFVDHFQEVTKLLAYYPYNNSHHSNMFLSRYRQFRQSYKAFTESITHALPRWRIQLKPPALAIGWPFRQARRDYLLNLKRHLDLVVTNTSELVRRYVDQNDHIFVGCFLAEEIDELFADIVPTSLTSKFIKAECTAAAKIEQVSTHDPVNESAAINRDVKPMLIHQSPAAVSDLWQTTYVPPALKLCQNHLAICQRHCNTERLDELACHRLKIFTTHLQALLNQMSCLKLEESKKFIQEFNGFIKSAKKFEKTISYTERQALIELYNDEFFTQYYFARRSCE